MPNGQLTGRKGEERREKHPCEKETSMGRLLEMEPATWACAWTGKRTVTSWDDAPPRSHPGRPGLRRGLHTPSLQPVSLGLRDQAWHAHRQRKERLPAPDRGERAGGGDGRHTWSGGVSDTVGSIFSKLF
uniref:Uncharacterized protein n=1 Tax=Myotis myotis TaxID=51298 RepID=A0A7J7RSH3_MYOMY|nr:hypothetical protein mMyoMyo1_010234 [Myotis myotis]